MDVYPPRDLPGRSDDWGRRVEGVAEDLYKAQVQLRQTVNNGQRATAGQLALLSRQLDRIQKNQEDLLGRTSRAVFWQGNVSFSSSATAVPMPGLEKTFHLTESRTVRIQSTLQVELYCGGGGFPVSSATLGYRLNGDFLPVNEFNSATVEYGVAGTSLRNQVTVVTVFERPAGNYTVTPWVSPFVSSGSSVIATLGSTVVDVLQRTA